MASMGSTTTTTTATTKAKTQRLFAQQDPAWQRFNAAVPNPANNLSSTQPVHQQQQQTNPYQRQYAHVYHQRLAVLGRSLLSSAAAAGADSSLSFSASQKEGTDRESAAACRPVVVSRILELPEDVLVTCVGTLVREASDATADTTNNNSNNTEEAFSYFLEDESGRVALGFPLTSTSTIEESTSTSSSANAPQSQTQSSSSSSPSLSSATPTLTTTVHSSSQLCTGIVIRVTGVVGTDGVLRVLNSGGIATAATVVQVIPPKPKQTSAPPILAQPTLAQPDPPDEELQSTPPTSSTKDAPYVLLLSGLECGSPDASSLPRDMVLSFLQGAFEHAKAKSVAHVILAGGLVAPSALAEGCRDLDSFCRQLTVASGIPVTALPGKDDPTTAQWPQRPFHSSLLPGSSSSRLLTRSPNPYAATFVLPQPAGNDLANNTDDDDDDEFSTVTTPPLRRRLVLGTDGTNVADFVAQTTLASELDALRHTLAHQHVCPTGPDSVPTAPHAESDPMVISTLPQQPSLYFCGNATRFGTQLVTVTLPPPPHGTTVVPPHHHHHHHQQITEPHYCRLVCIPKFIESSTAVLVNLDSLEVELLQFDASAAAFQ